MSLEEQVTQTERFAHRYRCFYGLTSKDALQLLSALILPLTLGVFTVVITVHQQKVAREQRMEDQQSARQQRIEDLELARQQRLEDRNESRLQREQDWEIAQTNQQVQSKTVFDRYRDEVLLAYIKEIGELLKENNGSLTSNSITTTLARVKTLNVIRQLDGWRNTHIIRFLYEAGQLTNTNQSVALDISTAELIDIGQIAFNTGPKIGKLSLTGVFFRNCTLTHVILSDIDFSSGWLININFSSASLENVDFSSVQRLNTIDFSSAELLNVNFSSASLENVDFSFARRLFDVHFLSALLGNVNFSSAWLNDVKFSSARLNNVKFSSAELKNVDFSSTQLDNVDFSSVQVNNVNFSSASLFDVNFCFARLDNINFLSVQRFHNVNFSSARLDNVNFSSARLGNIDFSSVQLDNVNFASARLDSANFHHANMSSTSLIQASCIMTHFDDADLSMAVFWSANVKGAFFNNADLTKVNFSLANLHKADFTNTKITDSQLQSALSIQDARLPNGTLGRDPNLIKNGHADCSISLGNNWQEQSGNVSTKSSDEDLNDCHFTLQSDAIGATMSQRIDLEHVWNSAFWTHSQAVLHARMTNGVSIQLSGINSTGMILDKKLLNSTENKITMILHANMQELEVLVKFSAHIGQNNQKSSWCDDIELFIDYDTEE